MQEDAAHDVIFELLALSKIALAHGCENPGRFRFFNRRKVKTAHIKRDHLEGDGSFRHHAIDNFVHHNAIIREIGWHIADAEALHIRRKYQVETVQEVLRHGSAAREIFHREGIEERIDIWMDGQDSSQKKTVNTSWVSPGYFQTLETRLLAGRDFDKRDTATSPKVAIVNQSFARALARGANPVGMSFHTPVGPHHPEFIVQIVGLVKDTKYNDLRDENVAIAFVPVAQDPDPDDFDTLMIRSSASPGETISAVKHRLAQANPEISLTFHVFESDIRDILVRERLMATLSGFFGFLAAVLAVIGLYGVMSYMVQRRTNEIGIRMALGAGRLSILGMILLDALLLLGVGIVVGLGLSVALGKTVSSLLFGVKPADPITLGLAAVPLAAVTVAASYIPARRASKVDPMVALRCE